MENPEYRAKQKAKFGSIEAGKQIEDTRERLRALVAPVLEGKGGDKASQFSVGDDERDVSVRRAARPEIANSIVDVDRAMRWGFAWELGPFEVWDAIGVGADGRGTRKRRQAVPAAGAEGARDAEEIVSTKRKRNHEYFDLASGAMKSRRQISPECIF